MKRRLAIVSLLLALLTALAGLGLLYYASSIARKDIELTHWRVVSPDWQGSPLRIVLLADIHALPHDGEYLDSLVRLILAQEPDAVFLLGDYLSGGEHCMEPGELARHLQPLSALRCYAVLGNHDQYYKRQDMLAMLHSFGARVVEGRRETLTCGGREVDIAGIRSILAYGKTGHVPRPRPGRPFLLLSHDPVGLRHAPAGTCAVLAGHTHGGQICLPGGRPLVRPDRLTPWHFMAGEVRERGIPLYVTRGVGTSVHALRLFCRPELTVVELAGEEKTGSGGQ